MTITINIGVDQERQVVERARRRGLPVDQYILHLVEEDLPPTDAIGASEREPASGDAWLEELRQLAATAPQTPYISAEALRREYLYEDRS